MEQRQDQESSYVPEEDQVDQFVTQLQEIAQAHPNTRGPDNIINLTSDPGASSAIPGASAVPNGGPQISRASVAMSGGFTRSLEEARNGCNGEAAKAPILHLSSLCVSKGQQEVETENWAGERGPRLYGTYRPEGSKTLMEHNAAVQAGATPKPFSPKHKEEARRWNSESQGPIKLFGSARFIIECLGCYRQVDFILVKIMMPMKPRLWLGSKLHNAIDALISENKEQALNLQHQGPEADNSLPPQPVHPVRLVQPRGPFAHTAPQPHVGFFVGLSQQAHERGQDMSVNETAQPDALDMMVLGPSHHGAITWPSSAAYPFSGLSQPQPSILHAPGEPFNAAWGMGQTTRVALETWPGKQDSFMSPNATMMFGAAQSGGGGSHGYSSSSVPPDVLWPGQQASSPFACFPSPWTYYHPQFAQTMSSPATAGLGGGTGTSTGSAAAALPPAGLGLDPAGTTVATREDQNHQHHQADMSGASTAHMQAQEQPRLDNTALSEWLAELYGLQQGQP